MQLSIKTETLLCVAAVLLAASCMLLGTMAGDSLWMYALEAAGALGILVFWHVSPSLIAWVARWWSKASFPLSIHPSKDAHHPGSGKTVESDGDSTLSNASVDETPRSERVVPLVDSPALIETSPGASHGQNQSQPAGAPRDRGEVAREMAQTIVHLCKTRNGRAYGVYRRFVSEGYDADVGYDEGMYVSLVAFAAHGGHKDFHEEVIQTMKAHGVSCPFGFFQALMKIFSSKQMYDKALGLYDLMKQQNVEPDAPMLRCLINFAFECNDPVKVEVFFAALKKHELPSMKSYTTLIRAYSKKNDAWAALKVLREMLDCGVETDSLVLNSVLSTCVGAGQLQIAETLVNESVQMCEEGQTLLADIVSFNILSKGYAQKGDFDGALKTLRASERAGLQPNDISYNTVIDAAVRSKRLDEAWGLVLEMGEKGIEADKYTCSILIKGLHNIGQGPAREAHLNTALEYLKRLGVSESSRLHEVVSFCLMESCLHMKDLSRTLEVFRHIQQQKVKVSVVTYGNVMKALGQAGRLRECFELWEGLKHTDLEPTAILYGILLDACINNGDLPRAMQVFEEAKSSDAVNTVMYTTILKGFARTKQVDEAMRFYHQMLTDAKQGKDVAPDLIAFSVLIQAHVEAGDMSGAFKVVEDMKGHHFKPDDIVFNTLLNGCFKQSNVELGERLFAEMLSVSVKPTAVTFSILVKLYGKARMLDKAFQMIDDMEMKFHLRPSVLVYTSLIQACIRNRQVKRALEVFDTMNRKGERGDGVTFGTLINGCVYALHFDAAIDLIQQAANQGIKVPTEVANNLLGAVLRKGQEHKYGPTLLSLMHQLHIPVQPKLREQCGPNMMPPPHANTQYPIQPHTPNNHSNNRHNHSNNNQAFMRFPPPPPPSRSNRPFRHHNEGGYGGGFGNHNSSNYNSSNYNSSSGSSSRGMGARSDNWRWREPNDM